MHIEDPQWHEYERRFRSLAEKALRTAGPAPELASSSIELCLYGDNGMSPEEEFGTLARLEQLHVDAAPLRCIEMTTSYWEDLILFVDSSC